MRRFSTYLLFSISLLVAPLVFSQQPAGAGTGNTAAPESPQPKPQGASNPAIDTTSRFVGYMTNKSFVFPDIAHGEGPLTAGGKFRLFVNQSVSPPYIMVAAINAAYSQAR